MPSIFEGRSKAQILVPVAFDGIHGDPTATIKHARLCQTIIHSIIILSNVVPYTSDDTFACHDQMMKKLSVGD